MAGRGRRTYPSPYNILRDEPAFARAICREHDAWAIAGKLSLPARFATLALPEKWVGAVLRDLSVMRLGLFGGTFDPIHVGHLILAEQCREACGLDRVWFVVAGEPPHKRGDRTPLAHRLEMVRIAIAGHSAFEASDLEGRRPGPALQRRYTGGRAAGEAGRRPLLPGWGR